MDETLCTLYLTPDEIDVLRGLVSEELERDGRRNTGEYLRALIHIYDKLEDSMP